MLEQRRPLIPRPLTSIRYQIISKKDTTWYINVNSLSACSSQGSLLLILDTTLQFCNLPSRKFEQQLMACLISFSSRLQARDIYFELKKCFCKEQSNVTLEFHKSSRCLSKPLFRQYMHISENCLGRILRCLAINL